MGLLHINLGIVYANGREEVKDLSETAQIYFGFWMKLVKH